MIRFAMALNCSFLTELWQKYGKTVRKIVHFSVLLACTIIVGIQLSECFLKLASPPVTSHVKNVLNQSMTYPAVTICRSPPYKADVLQSIRQTKDWENFPFGSTTLEKFWNEATYNVDEVHALSALHSLQHHVEIRSFFYMIWGQCHTVLPLIQTEASGKTFGYSIILHHEKEEIRNSSDKTIEEGWHIFLHSANDPWIESTEESAGLEESVFMEVGEALHVKIGVQEFRRVNKADDPCNNSYDHSIVRCARMCRNTEIIRDVGCTGPWLPRNNASTCASYDQLKELIKAYVDNQTCKEPCCNCIPPCRSAHFTPYVVRHKTLITTEPDQRLSNVFLFYSSRLIDVAEERLTYDWSLFLSDLGGSLGFLLGLSVLGIIGIVERLIDMLYSSLQSPRHNIALTAGPVKKSTPGLLDTSFSSQDSIVKNDCVCCTTSAGDKSLSIHNFATLKCENKLSPQPHCK